MWLHKTIVKRVDTGSKQEQHEVRKPAGYRASSFERDDQPETDSGGSIRAGLRAGKEVDIEPDYAQGDVGSFDLSRQYAI